MKPVIRFVMACWWLVLPALGQEPFTLVVLPDTQCYTDTSKNLLQYFQAQTDWIVAQRTNLNIRFALHEGDLTEQGGSTNPSNLVKWARASNCMARLDGVVPYLAVYGNHDYTYGANYSRDTGLFNQHFSLGRFQAGAAVVDNFPPGKSDNMGAVFTAGGADWLVVALEWAPGDAALAWADRLVRRYPGHRVIVLTHTFLYADGTWHGMKHDHRSTAHETVPPVNNGVEMWDKFVRKHPNIAMVLNGHVADGRYPAGALRVDRGDHGNLVYQMMANYQWWPNGGNGYLRILRFDPGAARVDVKTYSPLLNKYATDAANQFSLTNLLFFDTSAPPAPASLNAEAPDSRTCRLAWSAVEDAESGVAGYLVYRDTQQVAFTAAAEYVDKGIRPDTLHSYKVAAVNGAGLVSAGVASTVIFTPVDSGPAMVTNVWAAASNVVGVAFHKPPVPGEALDPANYQVGEGLQILSIALAEDGRSALLTTDAMEPELAYPIHFPAWPSRHRDGFDEGRDWLFEYAPPVLEAHFDDGRLDGWAVVDQGTIEAPSAWSVVSNRAQQASLINGPAWGSIFNREGTYLLWTNGAAREWTDYAVEAEVESGRDGGIGLLFRYQNASNFYRFEMDERFKYRRLFRRRNGVEEMLAWQWKGYTLNARMRVRIEAIGADYRVLVDGEEVFGGVVSDGRSLTNGTVALWVWRARPAWFDRVTVQPLHIGLATAEYDRFILDHWREAQPAARRPAAARRLLSRTADSDGDGVTNFREYVAMTNPMDARSRFDVTIVTANAERVVISMPSHTSRFYRVYACRDLGAENPQWWPMQSAPLRGQAGRTLHEDILRNSIPPLWPADKRFYRVDVRRSL